MRVNGCVSAVLAGFAAVAIAQAPQQNLLTIKMPVEGTSSAMSAPSQRSAVVGRDRKLRIWDIADGRLLRTIALSTAEVDVTAISDDGRWIFIGDHAGTATVWNAQTGAAQLRRRLLHYASSVAYTQDGKFIAIAPMGEPIQVFDLTSAKKLYQTGPVVGGTVALAFSRDGAKLATADADTAVRVYDARSGKQISENRDFHLEPLAVDFSSDGRQVVAGGGDKVLAVIDAATGKLVRSLPRTDEPASSLKISPDGTLVAVILMKAENMMQPAPVVQWEIATGKEKSSWMPLALALSIGWMRDGRLISASGEPGVVHFWRVP